MRTLLLFAGSFLLYALVPSRNSTYADDSVRWAYEITRSTGLVNVHHLFFNGLRLVYRWQISAGLAVEPDRWLSMYCALFGALGLVFLHAILRLAELKRSALLGTLLCAFTAGYWAYSIVGDVYVPATACMLSGVYWLWRGLWSESSFTRSGLLAALSFVLMLMHHQAYFVFAVGLVPGILIARGVRGRQIVRLIAVFVVTGAAVSAIYLGAHAQFGRGATLGEFLSGYAGHFDARPDQKHISAGTLVNAVAGDARAVISTNVLFASEPTARAVQKRFPYRGVYPSRYLVRNLSQVSILLIGISIVVVLFAGTVLLLRGLWSALRNRGFLATVLVAALAQALFFVGWEAISDEFWIWSTPILAFTMATGAETFGARARRWLAPTVAGLLVSTWLGSISLYADAGNDVDEVNSGYLSQLGAGDCLVGFDEIQVTHRVLLEQERIPFEYLNLYTRVAAWTYRDSAEIVQAVRRTAGRGGRTFVAPYLTRPPRSYLELIRLSNPTFDMSRRRLIGSLAEMDSSRIRWVPLTATAPGYFLDQDAVPGNLADRATVR